MGRLYCDCLTMMQNDTWASDESKYGQWADSLNYVRLSGDGLLSYFIFTTFFEKQNQKIIFFAKIRFGSSGLHYLVVNQTFI